jgi:hypothetical protein
MHADRAAMHHAAYSGRGAELDELPGGVDMHLTVLRIGYASAAEHRCKVMDRVYTLEGLANHGRIPDVAHHGRHPGSFQGNGPLAVPNQSTHPVPSGNQTQGKGHPRKARSAGNQYAL